MTALGDVKILDGGLSMNELEILENDLAEAQELYTIAQDDWDAAKEAADDFLELVDDAYDVVWEAEQAIENYTGE
jgi:hypothetical protein